MTWENFSKKPEIVPCVRDASGLAIPTKSCKSSVKSIKDGIYHTSESKRRKKS